MKGKILVSMFLLARTWDLAVHLGSHPMVHFINDQRSIQCELLLRPKASSEPLNELVQGLDDISLLVKKLRPVSESDDDQQFDIDQRCTRCDRRITTVSLPLSHVRADSMLFYAGQNLMLNISCSV